MANLAIIENLIIQNIIVGDPVDFPSYTDVTGISCGIGWTDNEDGTFTAPAPIIPPSIRIISTDEFIDRIPQPAWGTITNHTSNEAKTFVSLLNARAMINLDNDKTTYYVNKMLQAGIITQAEHDAIMT